MEMVASENLDPLTTWQLGNNFGEKKICLPRKFNSEFTRTETFVSLIKLFRDSCGKSITSTFFSRKRLCSSRSTRTSELSGQHPILMMTGAVQFSLMRRPSSFSQMSSENGRKLVEERYDEFRKIARKLWYGAPLVLKESSLCLRSAGSRMLTFLWKS